MQRQKNARIRPLFDHPKVRAARNWIKWVCFVLWCNIEIGTELDRGEWGSARKCRQYRRGHQLQRWRVTRFLTPSCPPRPRCAAIYNNNRISRCLLRNSPSTWSCCLPVCWVSLDPSANFFRKGFVSKTRLDELLKLMRNPAFDAVKASSTMIFCLLYYDQLKTILTCYDGKIWIHISNWQIAKSIGRAALLDKVLDSAEQEMPRFEKHHINVDGKVNDVKFESSWFADLYSVCQRRCEGLCLQVYIR